MAPQYKIDLAEGAQFKIDNSGEDPGKQNLSFSGPPIPRHHKKN